MALPDCLITGGAGQLARDLARLLPLSVTLTREELSVTDLGKVRERIDREGAKLVFNCAAYNAVDRAEQEPEIAFAVNSEGAANVARACRLAGARLVHFSTNYVFAGDGADPNAEGDTPRPRSAYGRSKLEGELRALEELPDALVIRSSGLFGHGGSAIKGGNFPERLLARAAAGERLAVVSDQRLNPTYTAHLAVASIAAAESGETGLLHLVAAGCCSFHEFAQEVLRVAGVDSAVEAIETPAGGAERPRNGCLASTRAKPLSPWQAGLREYWAARATSRV
jgi:dTDP-4-dehydrorhamnose reductase